MPEQAQNACVVWLHGADESGSSWAHLETSAMSGLGMRLPWAKWVFPDAPGGAWFDVEYPVLFVSSEPPRLDEALKAVHAILQELEASGIASSRIVLGGFGSGAALALLAGRTYTHALAGIAAISGWYLQPQQPSSDVAARTPVLLCHGDDDDEVPIEHYHSACARLQRDGVDLSCFRYDGLGHRECAEQLTVLAASKNFITDKLRTLTPSPPIPPEVRRAAAAEAAAKASSAEVPRCKLDEPTGASCRLESMTEADGALAIVLVVKGLASLSDADLDIGATELSLSLPGARTPFVTRFPAPIDATAAMRPAKFNKATGELRIRLTLA